ncbi:hypothetical protein BJX64DRAFT_252634 [Aspergillus heterothallicus]
MAEMLGIVSGSITVAETASAVFKLKRLWDEVRDAPDYIDSLIDQLSLVHPLLTETETELQADEQLLTNSSAARLSLTYCKKILWDLDGLAHDLRQQIEAKRRFSRGKAKIKVALGKDIIHGMQKRMQDALQLLSIAQQTYLIALAKRQPMLVAGHLLPLTEKATYPDGDSGKQNGSQLAPRTVPNKRAQHNFPNTSTLWRYSKFFGTFTCHTDKTADQVLFTRIALPYWLTGRVWDICAQTASHGWTFTLRQWTVRPADAEIFAVVREDNLPRMVQLFEARQASPYDRDPNGRTLLHCAMYYGTGETAQYLVDQGLDFHEPEAYGWTALSFIPYAHVHEYNETATVDKFSSLKSTNEFTDVLFDPDVFFPNKLDLQGLLFSHPSLRNLFDAELRQLPLEQWITFILEPYCDPKIFYDLLQIKGVTDADFVRQQLSSVRQSWLRQLAQVYFANSDGGSCKEYSILRMINADFQDWRTLTRWLLTGITLGELSSPSKYIRCSTPLFSGMAGRAWKWTTSPRKIRQFQKRMQQSLGYWLEDLQAAGVNLQGYGQQETRIIGSECMGHAPGRSLALSELNLDLGRQDRPRLTSFHYGPEPKDWELVWEEIFTEDYVGEFFSFAERLPSMPGAWVD